MLYAKKSLKDASQQVIHDSLKKIGGDGGLIAIDKSGNISMPFNTEGMYRAQRSAGKKAIIEIYA